MRNNVEGGFERHEIEFCQIFHLLFTKLNDVCCNMFALFMD